jgi:hypothetical protein
LVRPGGHAASVASFAASTTSSAVRAIKAARAVAVAAAAGSGGGSPGGAGTASGSSPEGSPQHGAGRSVRCISPDAVRVVSFSGGAGDERSAAFLSSSGLTAACCGPGPLDAKQGGAFSVYAASVAGGSISGRVPSASVLAGQGRRASDDDGGAAPCDSLSLHGTLLLCHEVSVACSAQAAC